MSGTQGRLIGAKLLSLPLVAVRAALWASGGGSVIQDFRHMGRRQFFETGSTAGFQAPLARKLRLQLAALHSATQIQDMDLPAGR